MNWLMYFASVVNEQTHGCRLAVIHLVIPVYMVIDLLVVIIILHVWTQFEPVDLRGERVAHIVTVWLVVEVGNPTATTIVQKLLIRTFPSLEISAFGFILNKFLKSGALSKRMLILIGSPI